MPFVRNLNFYTEHVLSIYVQSSHLLSTNYWQIYQPLPPFPLTGALCHATSYLEINLVVYAEPLFYTSTCS